MIQQCQPWIPKESMHVLIQANLRTLTGILLKGDWIVLPHSLQKEGMQLAGKGSHPRQAPMERRLRSYLFFFDMHTKVKVFVQTCVLYPITDHIMIRQSVGRQQQWICLSSRAVVVQDLDHDSMQQSFSLQQVLH